MTNSFRHLSKISISEEVKEEELNIMIENCLSLQEAISLREKRLMFPREMIIKLQKISLSSPRLLDLTGASPELVYQVLFFNQNESLGILQARKIGSLKNLGRRRL